MTSTSLGEQQVIDEVRDALAGLDTQKIPDATITQTHDRFVEPLLDDLTGSSPDQDAFDNAAIAWTAEKSFKAWLAFTRMRDREVEVYTDPARYSEKLEERTDHSLNILDVTRPPDIPNTVVTIVHDGKERKVNL